MLRESSVFYNSVVSHHSRPNTGALGICHFDLSPTAAHVRTIMFIIHIDLGAIHNIM